MPHLLFLAWIVLPQGLSPGGSPGVSRCCSHLKTWLVLKNPLTNSLTWLLSVSQRLHSFPHRPLHKLLACHHYWLPPKLWEGKKENNMKATRMWIPGLGIIGSHLGGWLSTRAITLRSPDLLLNQIWICSYWIVVKESAELIVGTKQGVWAVNAQNTWTPWWLSGKGFLKIGWWRGL